MRYVYVYLYILARNAAPVRVCVPVLECVPVPERALVFVPALVLVARRAALLSSLSCSALCAGDGNTPATVLATVIFLNLSQLPTDINLRFS